jgi:RimJ/RimL family protein N-acetyltransferase
MQIRLDTWSEADLDLLYRANSAEMTRYLAGPEAEELILARHRRYLEIDSSGTGRMFRIVLLPRGEAVGNIGYWERTWRGSVVYETGWNVLPAYQGLGIATAAGEATVHRARAERKHRYLHAFPAIDNPASNAVCRKLDFELLGVCDFEYPPGQPMRCNDWCLDLAAVRPGTSG